MSCGKTAAPRLPGGPAPGSPAYLDGIRTDRGWPALGLFFLLTFSITGFGLFAVGLAGLGLAVIGLSLAPFGILYLGFFFKVLRRRFTS